MKMSNKVYDVLKWIALIVMPALCALITAITEIWHLPYGPQVSGTVAAIATFLGALLQVSTAKYRNREDI